jgi:hypothetical protein
MAHVVFALPSFKDMTDFCGSAVRLLCTQENYTIHSQLGTVTHLPQDFSPFRLQSTDRHTEWDIDAWGFFLSFALLCISMLGGGGASDLVDLVCLGHDHAVPLDNHSIRVDTALK